MISATTKTLASTAFNLDGWNFLGEFLGRFQSDDNDKSDNNNNDNKSDKNDNNNTFIILIQLAVLDSKMQYLAAMHDCSCLF